MGDERVRVRRKMRACVLLFSGLMAAGAGMTAVGCSGVTVRAVVPSVWPAALCTSISSEGVMVSSVGLPLNLTSKDTADPSVVAPPRSVTFAIVTGQVI